MFQIVTPCPECGSTRIGSEWLMATIRGERFAGNRKRCLCGWVGEIFAPTSNNGEVAAWETISGPIYPVNWEEHARHLAQLIRLSLAQGPIEKWHEDLTFALGQYDQDLEDAGVSIQSVEGDQA